LVLERYAEVVALDPENLSAQRLWAGQLEEREKTEEALAQYREILRRQPEDYAAHLSAAHLCERLNRWSEAIRHARKALSLKPADTRYLPLYLAALYARSGYWEQARRELQALWERVKSSPPEDGFRCQVALSLGYTRHRLGDLQGAAEAYEEIPQSKTDYYAQLARQFRALVALECNRPEEARKWLEPARNSASRPLYLEALRCCQPEAFRRALAESKAAFYFPSAHISCASYGGGVKVSITFPLDYEPLFRRLADADPESILYPCPQGISLLAGRVVNGKRYEPTAEDLREAIALWERLSERYPEWSQAHYYLARASRQAGQIEAAREAEARYPALPRVK